MEHVHDHGQRQSGGDNPNRDEGRNARVRHRRGQDCQATADQQRPEPVGGSAPPGQEAGGSVERPQGRYDVGQRDVADGAGLDEGHHRGNTGDQYGREHPERQLQRRAYGSTRRHAYSHSPRSMGFSTRQYQSVSEAEKARCAHRRRRYPGEAGA